MNSEEVLKVKLIIQEGELIRWFLRSTLLLSKVLVLLGPNLH